ncbi:MAG TPA: GTP-binding protein, partial [Acetobacteraceae bacterium]
MRLKLFRAATTADAMARVRAELGADALILGTRRVADGIELTAALEPAEAQGAPPLPDPVPDPARNAALRFHGVPDDLRDALCHSTLDAALAAALPFGDLPL